MKFYAPAFTGTCARWFRLSVAPIFLISILGLALFGAGCSEDSNDDITFPDPPDVDQMNWLFDVYGTGADDVYACGNKGAMFHFDGSSWSFMDMGTGSPITKVWGPDDGTLYAAGHGGNVWTLSGTTWSSMSSGTSQNIYGLGIFNQSVHLCGANGAVRKLSGNTWNEVGQVMVIRSPSQPFAVEDTLLLNEDVASLLTVNEHFIGGAYKLPSYEGEYIGMYGIDGMVMSTDVAPEFDWQLRPLGADQFALSEWMMCTTNSATLNDNYLGTSEGWIFQLVLGDNGDYVWDKMHPDVTVDARSGIRDMWLDEDSNLYFVTDDGEMIFQTQDYDFGEGIGSRTFFDISHSGLTSIWGADTDNIFMTGFTEDMIFKVSMDFTHPDSTLIVTNEIPLDFPNKGGQSIGMFEDQFGMPRR